MHLRLRDAAVRLKEQGKSRWVAHQTHHGFGIHSKSKLQLEGQLRDAVAAIIELDKVVILFIVFLAIK